MGISKRVFFALSGLVLVLLVSACGSTPGTAATQSTPTPTPAVASTVKTAQATIKGDATTILNSRCCHFRALYSRHKAWQLLWSR